MSMRRSGISTPNLAPEVLKRLGYVDDRGRRPWWRRDRAVIPAIIFASVSFVLAMVTLAVIEYRGVGEPSSTQPNAGVLNRSLDRAASLRGLEEAFLRVRVPSTVATESPELDQPLPVIRVDSSPEIKPIVPLVPIFIPPATSTEVDGYERVVAIGPGRST